MLVAFISMIMNSFGQVFSKKSLSICGNEKIFNFISQIPIFLVVICVLIFYGTQGFSYLGLGLTFVTVMLYTIGGLLLFYVTKREKISFLIPYKNVSNIFTIVFGFFIFSDISLISLGISLFTIGLIIYYSIDFKNLKISKNVYIYIIGQIIYAIANIIVGFSLIYLTALDYFSYYILVSIIVGAVIFYFSQISRSEIINISKKYYPVTFIGGLIGRLSWFISLVVIKNLGLSVSTLISILGMFITFGFGFLLFKDIPSKKDLFISLLVGCLVGIGFYFK